MTSMRCLALGAIAIAVLAWGGPAAAVGADQPAGNVESSQGVLAGSHGVSQRDLATLMSRIERNWNSGCVNEPSGIFALRILIGRDGYLQGPVDTGGLDIGSNDDARRAVAAVHSVEPYPAVYRGLRLTVRFDPQKACAERK